MPMLRCLIVAIAVQSLLPGFGLAQTVTRGPYLQKVSSTTIVVRWRTDLTTDSVVFYGASSDNLNQSAVSASGVTEHEVTVTGLAADSRTFYGVGDLVGLLSGGDISLQLQRAGKKNHFARTFVTILNQDAEPVSGVGVTGSWSVLTIQPVSGVSNSNGIVTLDSSKVRTNLSGQFILTVTGVSAEGFDYDVSANKVDSGCIDNNGVDCSGVKAYPK